jgi:hypothetical protein
MVPARASTAVVLSALLFAATTPVSAASACSSDAFSIDGTSLTVELCPTPTANTAGKAALSETLTVKGQPPLVRAVTVELLPGADTSRTIDDAPLQKLGLGRSLHLTIAYKNGAARLEHALLVPGAVALK